MIANLKTRAGLLLLFLMSYLVAAIVVQQFVSQAFNVAQIEGRFSADSRIYFRNANGFHPILSETTVGAIVQPVDTSQTITLQLANRLISKFHVEVMHNGTPFVIERIVLHSFFSNRPLAWNQQQIASEFDLIVNPDGRSTTFDIRQAVSAPNLFFQWVIPLILASLVTLVVRFTRWAGFAPLRDTVGGASLRGQNNITALDGIRGLAALLVVFHHAGSSFPGSGALGVWLFFVLSGFLLARGFVRHPANGASGKYLVQFVHRRFNRIVPMYFFFVCITYLFRGHFETAIRHLLFVQGDGHLWTIIHEIYFYLLLPLLGWLLWFICKGRPLVTITLLLCGALAWRWFGSADIFGIYALGIKARVFLEVFLVGMAGSYWYFGCYEPARQQAGGAAPALVKASGWCGLGLLVMVWFASTGVQDYSFHQLSREYPVVAALIALAVLLTALTSQPGSAYLRILQNPALRYIGVIGYSFYLLHPTILFMLHDAVQYFLNVPLQNIAQGWWIAFTVLGTTLFASFTYAFIERPFLNKK